MSEVSVNRAAVRQLVEEHFRASILQGRERMAMIERLETDFLVFLSTMFCFCAGSRF